MNTPNQILVSLMSRLTRVQLQNRLMRAGDREIALAMMYMEDRDRSKAIACLGARKAERVREELEYQQRLSVTYDQYRIAVTRILDLLREQHGTGPVKSYIRPRGTGRSGSH